MSFTKEDIDRFLAAEKAIQKPRVEADEKKAIDKASKKKPQKKNMSEQLLKAISSINGVIKRKSKGLGSVYLKVKKTDYVLYISYQTKTEKLVLTYSEFMANGRSLAEKHLDKMMKDDSDIAKELLKTFKHLVTKLSVVLCLFIVLIGKVGAIKPQYINDVNLYPSISIEECVVDYDSVPKPQPLFLGVILGGLALLESHNTERELRQMQEQFNLEITEIKKTLVSVEKTLETMQIEMAYINLKNQIDRVVLESKMNVLAYGFSSNSNQRILTRMLSVGACKNMIYDRVTKLGRHVRFERAQNVGTLTDILFDKHVLLSSNGLMGAMVDSCPTGGLHGQSFMFEGRLRILMKPTTGLDAKNLPLADRMIVHYEGQVFRTLLHWRGKNIMDHVSIIYGGTSNGQNVRSMRQYDNCPCSGMCEQPFSDGTNVQFTEDLGTFLKTANMIIERDVYMRLSNKIVKADYLGYYLPCSKCDGYEDYFTFPASEVDVTIKDIKFEDLIPVDYDYIKTLYDSVSKWSKDYYTDEIGLQVSSEQTLTGFKHKVVSISYESKMLCHILDYPVTNVHVDGLNTWLISGVPTRPVVYCGNSTHVWDLPSEAMMWNWEPTFSTPIWAHKVSPIVNGVCVHDTRTPGGTCQFLDNNYFNYEGFDVMPKQPTLTKVLSENEVEKLVGKKTIYCSVEGYELGHCCETCHMDISCQENSCTKRLLLNETVISISSNVSIALLEKQLYDLKFNFSLTDTTSWFSNFSYIEMFTKNLSKQIDTQSDIISNNINDMNREISNIKNVSVTFDSLLDDLDEIAKYGLNILNPNNLFKPILDLLGLGDKGCGWNPFCMIKDHIKEILFIILFLIGIYLIVVFSPSLIKSLKAIRSKDLDDLRSRSSVEMEKTNSKRRVGFISDDAVINVERRNTVFPGLVYEYASGLDYTIDDGEFGISVNGGFEEVKYNFDGTHLGQFESEELIRITQDMVGKPTKRAATSIMDYIFSHGPFEWRGDLTLICAKVSQVNYSTKQLHWNPSDGIKGLLHECLHLIFHGVVGDFKTEDLVLSFMEGPTSFKFVKPTEVLVGCCEHHTHYLLGFRLNQAEIDEVYDNMNIVITDKNGERSLKIGQNSVQVDADMSKYERLVAIGNNNQTKTVLQLAIAQMYKAHSDWVNATNILKSMEPSILVTKMMQGIPEDICSRQTDMVSILLDEKGVTLVSNLDELKEQVGCVLDHYGLDMDVDKLTESVVAPTHIKWRFVKTPSGMFKLCKNIPIAAPEAVVEEVNNTIVQAQVLGSTIAVTKSNKAYAMVLIEALFYLWYYMLNDGVKVPSREMYVQALTRSLVSSGMNADKVGDLIEEFIRLCGASADSMAPVSNMSMKMRRICLNYINASENKVTEGISKKMSLQDKIFAMNLLKHLNLIKVDGAHVIKVSNQVLSSKA